MRKVPLSWTNTSKKKYIFFNWWSWGVTSYGFYIQSLNQEVHLWKCGAELSCWYRTFGTSSCTEFCCKAELGAPERRHIRDDFVDRFPVLSSATKEKPQATLALTEPVIRTDRQTAASKNENRQQNGFYTETFWVHNPKGYFNGTLKFSGKLRMK